MSDDDWPTLAAAQIELAWSDAVNYRKTLAKQELIRPHLEDMDLFGVLKEMKEDGYLIGEPLHVMARIIKEDRRLTLPPYLTDPAQEIYDASLHLLIDMGALNEKWRIDSEA